MQFDFLNDPATIQQVNPTPLEVAINRAREQYGIPAHFVPVATATGVTAWATKNSMEAKNAV